MAFTNSQQPTKHSAQRTAHSAQRKIKLKYLTLIFAMALFVNSQQLKAQTSPNIVPANGNAGFGTTAPTEKVEINGKLKVIDKAIFKNDVTIEDDLKIKSLENFSISANRILGINPNGKIIAPSGLLLNNSGYKLDITGNLKVGGKLDVNYITVNDTAYLKTIATNRIKSLNGDSILYFGDSTIIFDHINHKIYTSIAPSQPTNGGTFYKGLSIGAKNNSYAYNSYSMGTYLQTKSTTTGNLILGSGIVTTGGGGDALGGSTITPFVNDVSNSLMVGFLSTQPTFFVGPNKDTKDKNGYGNVGIATKNPTARLDVNGGPLWTSDDWKKAIKIANADAIEMQGYEVKWGIGTGYNDTWSLFYTKTEEQTDAAHYVLTANNSGTVTVHGNLNVVGNVTATNISNTSGTSPWLVTGSTIYYNVADAAVSIGDTYVPPGYKLAVNGKMITEEVNVKLRLNWPDYVFDKKYDLMTLTEVEDYIEKNKHLPGIKSETEIKAEGLSLGEMQSAQMQKIEELTLYLIEQNKKIEALSKEIEGLKNK